MQQNHDSRQITTIEQQDMTSPQVSTTNPGASINTMTVDNPSIVAKMNKFHEHVAQLHFSYCATCKESFPTVTLCAKSSECTRCSRDSRTPKLYCGENNMDPGTVPIDLRYVFYYHCMHVYSGTNNSSHVLMHSYS